MDNRITPEQVYQAFKEATKNHNYSAGFAHYGFTQCVADTWDDVKDEHKGVFEEMAWKMNMIISEMEVK